MRRISNTLALRALTLRAAPTSAIAFAPLARGFATTSVAAAAFRPTSVARNNFDDDDGLSFDPTAALQKEATYVSRGSQVEDLVREWLPSNAGEDLRAKLRKHLHAMPIGSMISASNRINITHLENEKGEEVNRVPGILQGEDGKNKQFTLESAIALAASCEGGKVLVQVAENGGVSYCRIRDEKTRFLRTVADEIEALERALGGGTAAPTTQRVRKLRDLVTHAFSDVVDAHFIGWRSKKIAADLAKAHPVKLAIQKFQNPDGALTKMREMLEAVKAESEAKSNIHHCSGIQLSANELSVTLMPVLDDNSKIKAIRHPSDQEWTNAERRMFEATGGRGTYQKSNVLKKQAIGAREFRTDRFGRRIEDRQ